MEGDAYVSSKPSSTTLTGSEVEGIGTSGTDEAAAAAAESKSEKQVRSLFGLLVVGIICLLSFYTNVKNVSITKLIVSDAVGGRDKVVDAGMVDTEHGKLTIATASKWINTKPEATIQEEKVIEVERKDLEDDTDKDKGTSTAATADTVPTDTTTTTSTTGSTSTSNTGNSKYDPSKPLNIVLFFADDWSYNMIGKTNPYLQTPVIDQLAKEGIHFSHNCVVASVCMQSRATLYTGQYSMRHQTYKSWADVKMYEPHRWNDTLYPTMMRQKYHVGFFGKYHHLEVFPTGIPVFTKFRSVDYSHFVNRGGVTKHVTQWNEEDGLEFLDDRPRDEPFFLTISFFATHAEDGNAAQYRPMNSSMHLYKDTPVPYPKTYTEEHWRKMPYFFNDANFGRGRFYFRYKDHDMYQHHMKNTCRMVTEVDTAMGNIIDKLKDQGVYDNTLIIFTTDNGNLHGQHGLAEKWYSYEESLRTPLIIKDPRMPTELIGTTNDEFTLNIDLAPTIISAAGGVVPEVMQGRDMAQLYIDAKNTIPKWRKEFLYEFHDGNPDIPDSLALVNKEFKYIFWDAHNFTQLFNLQKDPFEEYDLFNETDKALLDAMWERLLALNSTLVTNHTY